MSNYRPFDVAIVRQLSGNESEIPNYLINRLGDANTTRRQLLEYYKRHHEKIAAPDFQSLPSERRPQSLQVDTKTDQPSVTQHRAPTENDTGNEESPRRAAEAPTAVTTVYNSFRDAADGRSVADYTDTSYAATESAVGNKGKAIWIQVPRIPKHKNSDEEDPIQCPYCFGFIEISGRASWT